MNCQACYLRFAKKVLGRSRKRPGKFWIACIALIATIFFTQHSVWGQHLFSGPMPQWNPAGRGYAFLTHAGLTVRIDSAIHFIKKSPEQLQVVTRWTKSCLHSRG